jgi:anti-anti-sigma factor
MMDVDVRQKGTVSIIDVKGKMPVGEEHLRLRDTVQKLLDDGNRLIIFNMLEVPFMDSSGLGETAACKLRIADKDAVIKLVLRPRGKVHEIFRITGLNESFEIFADEQEAIASFIPKDK